ncbi:hypothetical protein [Paraburkholderia sp. JHI2823]|uniref:hypothetical protein n=1 Tax=Paraburkholderia sp. JHI2823 TaxID=3112960 RepID=UPI00319E42E3
MLQAVAAPGHRLDQVAVSPKGAANGGNVYVQAVFLDHAIRPHFLHDFVFGNEFAIRENQDFENVESACSQRHFRSCPIDFSLRQIDFDISDAFHHSIRSGLQ